MFYAGTGTSASGSNRWEMGEYLHTAAVCYLEPLDNFSLIQWIDADMHVKAVCGDAIVHHCLTTGVGCFQHFGVDYADTNYGIT